MIIHHYTDINTLALILKGKKIKFNRLDRVDDLEEGQIMSDGIKIGKYMFVSCWTETDEESIPLWKMYSNGENGVRISLEQDMFLDYIIEKFPFGNSISIGSIVTKIPETEFVNRDYFVVPVFGLDSDMFYRKIEYVADIKEKTVSIVKRTMADDIHASITIEFSEIGKYKNKRWEFQEESRFAVVIIPYNPLFDSNPSVKYDKSLFTLYNNQELPFDSYFLKLKPEVLNSMTVTLSPSSGDAQRIIVESLCQQFAPGATINDSSLKNGIKLK